MDPNILYTILYIVIWITLIEIGEKVNLIGRKAIEILYSLFYNWIN